MSDLMCHKHQLQEHIAAWQLNKNSSMAKNRKSAGV